MSGSAVANTILERMRWTSGTAALLERADLPLKVSEYLLIQLATLVALGAVVFFISGLWFVGLPIGLAGLLAVRLWVSSRARRRMALLEKQLPVALHLMSTSLKSGFSIMEATRTVAREMDAPIAKEFSRLIDETRVGGSFEDSLARMVERVQSADLRIVARALDIHRKVGGDLAGILESVSITMREREDLRGHVLALTAQQRFGGLIVGLLPAWVLGFFAIADPDFIAPLWEERLGQQLLVAGISMEIVGFIIMRRILRIEV
jgi:tight adherence protein B